jgi:hypothetical protein
MGFNSGLKGLIVSYGKYCSPAFSLSQILKIVFWIYNELHILRKQTDLIFKRNVLMLPACGHLLHNTRRVFALKAKTLQFFEVSITVYQSTRRNNPESSATPLRAPSVSQPVCYSGHRSAHFPFLIFHSERFFLWIDGYTNN